MNIRDRIVNKSMPVPWTGCWIWLGSTDPDGYARLNVNNKNRQAHRISYLEFIGEIPKKHQIDHLCRTRSCVNPNHLEAVTQKENIRRGDVLSMGAPNRNKTHCKQGHEYNEENTYFHKTLKKGKYFIYRKCKKCSNSKRRES